MSNMLGLKMMTSICLLLRVAWVVEPAEGNGESERIGTRVTDSERETTT